MAKALVRKNFGRVQHILQVPNLIEIQKHSFERFLQKDVPAVKRDDLGLQAAFTSVFPIVDYNETASIEFIEYIVGQHKYDARESLQKGINYAAPLKIKVKLNLWEKNESGKKRLKESKEEEVYLGELPLMTDTGTFIINGTERVVVSQLHRSPGVFFSHEKGKTLSGRALYSARIIPARGSWFDFEFDSKDKTRKDIDIADRIFQDFFGVVDDILSSPQPVSDERVKIWIEMFGFTKADFFVFASLLTGDVSTSSIAKKITDMYGMDLSQQKLLQESMLMWLEEVDLDSIHLPSLAPLVSVKKILSKADFVSVIHHGNQVEEIPLTIGSDKAIHLIPRIAS